MLSETAIVTAIMDFADVCEDPAPTAIHYVSGTRGALNRLTSQAEFEGVDATTPAVLVEAIGHFKWRHSAPPGASPYTTGTAISLVISDLTGAVLDRGIGGEPHDLSSLGQVHHPAVPG